MKYPTIETLIGATPLIRLQRLVSPERNNVVLLKMEGQNPAGSVKDRAALCMINEAEQSGRIQPGDTLIEATSGNTGIALAMVAAIKGYRLVLIMPDHMSDERKVSMSAYGAELVEVTQKQGMEGARDLALAMEQAGEGIFLNQFGNQNNPKAHFQGTGPEIWQQTNGEVTHFISAMGTTGTVMGTSAYLKQKNPSIEIIGLQPADNAQIPGIRRWPDAYRPDIYDSSRVGRVLDIAQENAEQTARQLARVEGIFAGVSSGGAVSAALRLEREVQGATIVTVICDRGDRYLSTGVFG